MTYQLTIKIDEESIAGRKIADIATTEHVSREEAVLKILTEAPEKPRANKYRIIGAFKDDADLMDEVVQLAMEDRQRRNSAPPHE